MIISLIAAVAENGVIGKDNDLVWRLPDDMKFFMNTTKNHCVLTGRRNYESIPTKYRPLRNRTNIVVTRQPDYGSEEGIQVAPSVEEGVAMAKSLGEQELFVIGGGQIYEQTINLAQRLYITEVMGSFDGDTYFPQINRSQWEELSRIRHPKDKKHPYEFYYTVLEKIP